MQPFGDFDEHLITRVVPVAVVDGLEIVEVDEQDGDLGAGKVGLREDFTDRVVERRPVRQAGERIPKGLPRSSPRED